MTDDEMMQLLAPVATMMRDMSDNQSAAFSAVVTLFAECCKSDAELGAVLLVRRPVNNDWVMHINVMNIDTHDTYELLDLAYKRVAEKISEEAPARDRYN